MTNKSYDLAIIPCGVEKIWVQDPSLGAVPAGQVYIGSFHLMCRQYAEQEAERVIILSAKHGFLDLRDLVPGPYDTTFNQRGSTVITEDQLCAQVMAKRLIPNIGGSILLLGGKQYSRRVHAVLGPHPVVIDEPLKGLGGIGYMRRWLNKHIVK